MNNGQRSLLFLAGGLAAGFAVATLMQPDDGGETFRSSVDAPLEGRIVELERRLASESAARRALSEEVEVLRGEVDAFAAPERIAGLAPSRAPGTDDPGEDAANGSPPLPDLADLRARVRRTPPTPEELEQRRLQRFVDAGFTVARAEWIEQRSAELQMQVLEAQYEAARSGDRERAREVPSIDEALRAELGDAEYERYLEATGRSTRIGVRSVLPSSPAEQVGLQQGDEIVSYGGKRVFDMADLNRLTLEGQPGETVVMEVMRDGQPLQLYVPRGPIGISGGGGGRRFP